MATSNADVVRRFYHEVLNDDRPEVAGEIADASFTVHGFPGRATGPEALMATSRSLRGGFPDLHFTLEDVVAQGDRVAVRFTMTGTHTGHYRDDAPTGRSIRIDAIVIFRVADGRLTDLWPQVDIAGLQRQLREPAPAR